MCNLNPLSVPHRSMRFFAYHEQMKDGRNKTVTVSEDYLRKTYWPYWQEMMCQTEGLASDLAFEDCVNDWARLNRAWEIKDS